jgi:hypothetical protein
VAGVLVRALAAHGGEWCAEFSQAASEAKVDARRTEVSQRLVRLVMPLLAHFELPMPTGPAYPQAWAAYYVAAGEIDAGRAVDLIHVVDQLLHSLPSEPPMDLDFGPTGGTLFPRSDFDF